MKKSAGKKMRAPNPRRSLLTQTLTAVMVEKFHRLGFFSSSGELVRPVIKDWFLEQCTDHHIIKDPYTKRLVKRGGSKITKQPIDALMNSTGRWRESKAGYSLPKRWEDTTERFRREMYLDALKCEGIPHRQMTFWIGKDLITESKQKNKPLAALLLKRLRERLSRLLGDTEFGLWFNIEAIPGEPDKLHAHGLLYVTDKTWLMNRSVKYDKLRNAIRDATGYEPNIDPDAIKKQHWLLLPKKNLNHGNQAYCSKSRRGRRFHMSHCGEPSQDIGYVIEATSHSLRRRSKAFYERMRPLLSAFITGEVLDWDDAQWEAIGATEDDGLIDFSA